MEKKLFYTFFICGVLLFLGVLYITTNNDEAVPPVSNGSRDMNMEEAGSQQFVSETDSKDIARSWIEAHAETYRYDGEDLSYQEILYPEIAGCVDCYQFVFTFTSRHGGYGDRSDEMVIQVITSHETIVTVEHGEVTRAVTDGKFDEVSQSMIDVESGEVEAGERFGRSGVLVYNNPGLMPNTWFLLYEEPGKPAITLELEFTGESMCYEGEVQRGVCSDGILEQGKRVFADGIIGEDGVLTVEHLTIQI
jgi:hypothetical protein